MRRSPTPTTCRARREGEPPSRGVGATNAAAASTEVVVSATAVAARMTEASPGTRLGTVTQVQNSEHLWCNPQRKAAVRLECRDHGHGT
jgi:hypothetical protein